MTVSAPQRSFTGGEWAPSLAARVDLDKYATALQLCENFVVQPYGGVATRPGTKYLAEAIDSAKPLRLIPFQFSVEQGYILEFGDYTMRVYRDGALTYLDSASVAAWVTATGYVVGNLVQGDLDDSQTTIWSSGVLYAVGDYVKVTHLGVTPYYARCMQAHTGSYVMRPLTADSTEWEYLGTASPQGLYRCILNHTSAANDEPWVGPAWATYWVLDGAAGGAYVVATPYAAEDLARLTFEQSFDYLFLQHPDYAPYELSRTGHAAWAINAVVFGAGIGAPTALTGGTGTTHNWQVTAVSDSGEESLPSNTQAAASGTLTWTPPAVGSIHYYNVYQQKNASGYFGWVARVPAATHLIDATLTPDPQKSPPEAKTPFAGVGDYPGAASFFEQRLVYARTDNNPQTLWGSVVGSFRNFNISTPIQDDDSYEFTLASRSLHDIRWMIPLEDLIIGTGSGEWRMYAGGTSNAVTPTSVDLKQQSQWGSSHLRPVMVGNTILFIDASKAVMRDLTYNLDVEGYAGNDLSLLANHLFVHHEIVDMAYEQHPDSVIWAVREDGVLLGMTYAREHQVWGWHRHITDGLIENVATIFNAAGVVHTYLVVKRTIGGSEVKHIEVFKDRLPDDDITQAWCVDGGAQFSGWNTTGGMVASIAQGVPGGTDWTVGSDLAVLISGAFGPFVAGDVGRYLKLKTGEDSVIVEITAYTSATRVEVTPWNRPVPTDMQGVAAEDWAWMATALAGLDNLEGKDVAILADGNVRPSQTVASGAITLDEPAAVVVAGLGYVCNLQTMEIEIALEDGTLQDRLRNAVWVTVRLDKSRSFFAGPDADHLDEMAFRKDEDYGEPIVLFTGDKDLPIEPSDGKTGRVYLRVESPLPSTVLSIIPKMDVGDG